MALTDLIQRESGTIRPGDVVFDNSPWRGEFPIHVGIYVGREQFVDGQQILRVRGLPETPETSLFGDSDWPTFAGTPEKPAVDPDKTYRANILGHRKDVDKIHVARVVLESTKQRLERSRFGPCEWAPPRELIVDERRGLFVRGTCAQFVEFVYEVVGLDLIRQTELYNPHDQPEDRKRVYPTTQIHVFYRGAYPLRGIWDRRYERYPDCIFGERSDA